MKKLPLLFALLLLFSHLSFGQIPRQISYQGVLTETDGSPVSDGNYSMTFSLYETAMGGSFIWQEAKTVLVLNGVFNVMLGDVVPLSPGFDKEYWLGVRVGAATELALRVKLASSAYSLNSQAVGGYEVSPTPSPNALLPLDNNGKYPASTMPFLVDMGGVSSTSNVNINTTTNTEILSFTVNQTGPFKVSLNANLVGEISGDGSGRYDFRINKGSVSGTTVARAWWRPGASGGLQALTFTLTGTDTASGPTTYYLVARKFDASAKDLLVFISYLNAVWVTN